jgi:nucleoside-diphosphate-sugar epimerase
MVYGDFDCGVYETAQCNPRGQYGIMKYMGEKLVQDYTDRGRFDHVIVRPSAVYGEYDVEDRVVSKFILAAIRGETLKVNGPNEVLDFTHVEDTAMGIVCAATASAAINKTFNITHSDARRWTLYDAAQLCVNIAGNGRIEERNRDLAFPSRGRLSIESAVRTIGYHPKVGVEDGFRRYYRWFKESEYWQTRL